MLTLGVVLAFAVAGAMTVWMARPNARLSVMDVPNERSLHEAPIPRGGGLGILAGITVAMVVVGLGSGLGWLAFAVLAAAGAVGAVSYADDWFGLGVVPRLITHFVVAAVIVFGLDLWPDRLALPGGSLALGSALMAPLALVAVVWLINLYNFMDGMDGFAGGMAVFGFGTVALLAHPAEPALAATALLVAAGAGGFLVFNFPPARIFMGDVGSSALGLLAAALLLWGDVSGAFPWWTGALAFSVFVTDASVTLVRRALNRERVWQAHRSHFYQRLVTLGWSQRRTVLMYYCLMAATSSLALASQSDSNGVQVASVLAVLLMIAGLMAWVTWRERQSTVEGEPRRGNAGGHE